MSIINALQNSVKNANAKQTAYYLSIVPVEKLTSDRADLLLGRLLKAIFYTRHPTDTKKFITKLILFRWANKDLKTKEEVEGESITVFESLFFNSNVDYDLLKFLAGNTNYTLYRIVLDVLESMFNNDSQYNILFGLKRIFKIYEGLYDRSEIETLRDKALEIGNNPVYLYINIILKNKMKKYAPRPKWIINEIKLETESQLKDKIESVKPVDYDQSEIIKIIKTEAKKNNIQFKNLRYIEEEIKNLDHENQMDVIRPFIKNEIEKNALDVFRLYGPENRYPFSSSEDLKDYRSRMLKCDYFEIDPDTGESSAYDGVCWRCSLHLKHKWYSVRAPMLGGGWKGWFCNWECMSEWVNDIYEPNFSKDTEVDQIYELIHVMKSLVEKFGIWDRLEY